MKVFIGMETSGVSRRAFQALGHTVISCDLLPAQDQPMAIYPGGNSSHWQGDVFGTLEYLAETGWEPDLAIFHPDCTYLTGSAEWAFKDPDFVRYPGVGYHQKLKPGTLFGAARRAARAEAIATVRRILALPIPRICVENPVGALSNAIRKPDQIIQPFEFGADASKKTCLWLVNLPPLPVDPSAYCKPRMVCRVCKATSGYDAAFGSGCLHCGAEAGLLQPRWANQTDGGQNRLPPSDDRWSKRSDTFGGIAGAFAQTWGGEPAPAE